MMKTIYKPSNIKFNIQLSEFFTAVETGHTECCIYTHLSLLEMNVAPGNLQLFQTNIASQLRLVVPSLHVSFHFPPECQLFHLKTNKQTNLTCKFTAGKRSLKYNVFVKQDLFDSTTIKLHTAESFLRR